MFGSKLVILLLFIAGQTEGLCQIRPWYRGRFNIVGNENTQLIVRRNTMVAVQNGIETVYKCLDSDYSAYLMETQDGNRVICLSIGQMMDTYYEFTVRRISNSDAENVRFFDTERKQPGATVENSCTNYNGPTIALDRTRSGCQFPPILRRAWQFEGDFVKSVTFTTNKMSLTYKDGKILKFSCERMDKDGDSYDIAMIKPSMAPRKDGLLCLNITPDGSQMLVKRMNSANFEAYKLIKLMYRHPIYLHSQCDLIDAPVYAGRLI